MALLALDPLAIVPGGSMRASLFGAFCALAIEGWQRNPGEDKSVRIRRSNACQPAVTHIGYLIRPEKFLHPCTARCIKAAKNSIGPTRQRTANGKYSITYLSLASGDTLKKSTAKA
jgi:hypothetical protein